MLAVFGFFKKADIASYNVESIPQPVANKDKNIAIKNDLIRSRSWAKKP